MFIIQTEKNTWITKTRAESDSKIDAKKFEGYAEAKNFIDKLKRKDKLTVQPYFGE